MRCNLCMVQIRPNCQQWPTSPERGPERKHQLQSLTPQSVTRLTQEPEVPGGHIMFFLRRAVISYWRKYVHSVLVNSLGGLSHVVRLTASRHDHGCFIVDVKQQHNNKNAELDYFCNLLYLFFRENTLLPRPKTISARLLWWGATKYVIQNIYSSLSDTYILL